MKHLSSARPIAEHLRWSARCREHFFPWRSNVSASLRISGIAEAGISDLYPGYSLGRTDPRYHLLVYTTHGKGVVTGLDGRWETCAGEALVIPAHTPFRYAPLRGRWRYLWIHLIQNKRWAKFDGATIQVSRTSLTKQLDDAMVGFLKEYRSKRFGADQMVALYSEAITICVTRDHGANQPDEMESMEGRLEDLWQAVYSNLMHPWTVQELASRVGISPAHLYRLTLRFSRITPMKMVQRIRMEHAQELLIQQDWPLRVISERVGYRDQFAFAVSFKRFSGVTPGQFRLRR